jgi:hypothetical protein
MVSHLYKQFGRYDVVYKIILASNVENTMKPARFLAPGGQLGKRWVKYYNN